MRFSPGCSCCAPPPCVSCDPKNPEKIRITIAGAANGSCSDCADYNTSVMLTYSGVCFWSNSTADGPCGVADWWQFELLDIDGDLTAQVSLYRGETLAALWQASVESYVPLDCCDELDGVVLANISDDDTYCDWTGSTITLEAICGETSNNCDGCIGNTYPDEMEVTIAGFTDISCDCTVANNTFVIPRNTTGVSVCTWSATFVPSAWCVTEISITVTISYNSGTNTTTLSGVIAFARFEDGMTKRWSCGQFSTSTSGKIDCMALDQDIPLTDSSCQSRCDASGVTFHVRSA